MAGGGVLIGRERELVEVERMLVSARLVTVTGAGGVREDPALARGC